MHTAITNLHALLTDLQSHDLAQMSKEESDHFRINVTNQFSVATGGLQTLLLGAHAAAPRWLWKAEQAESFGNDWIATFTIVDTGQMESAVGQPERVRIAAALFPGLVLTVNIFAAYHHPVATGLQVDPEITVGLTVSGEPELTLVGDFLDLARELIPETGQGLSISVIPRENCCDEFRNPTDVHTAFQMVASAARTAARNNWGDDEVTLTENIDFVIKMDSTVEVERMQEAFEFLGQMFTTVVVARK